MYACIKVYISLYIPSYTMRDFFSLKCPHYGHFLITRVYFVNSNLFLTVSATTTTLNGTKNGYRL